MQFGAGYLLIYVLLQCETQILCTLHYIFSAVFNLYIWHVGVAHITWAQLHQLCKPVWSVLNISVNLNKKSYPCWSFMTVSLHHRFHPPEVLSCSRHTPPSFTCCSPHFISLVVYMYQFCPSCSYWWLWSLLDKDPPPPPVLLNTSNILWMFGSSDCFSRCYKANRFLLQIEKLLMFFEV